MTHRYVLFGAAYLAIYLGVGWALSGHPAGRSTVGSILLLAPFPVLAGVILARRRQWLGCQRLFWDAFAAGAVLWALGFVGRLWNGGDPTGPLTGWHTAFTLSGSVAPILGLMARPHLGVRPYSTGAAAIVIASYGLLAAFIYGYFVFVPALLGLEAVSRSALVALGQGTRVLLAAGAVFIAIRGRATPWRVAYLLIAAGAFAGFVLRSLTISAPNSIAAAGTIAGLAWLVPALAFVWAAVVSPSSPTHREVVDTPASPAVLSAFPALLIPLIGYTVPVFHTLGDEGDSLRMLLTSAMSVGALGLLVLRLSAQGGTLQRLDNRARLLAAAIEQTGDGIVITRADGTIEHANDAFLRTIGYTRQDLMIPHAGLQELALELCGPRVFEDVQRDGCWRGTLVRRRRDGSAFHSACTVVALRDSSGRITHLVYVERDITDDLKLRDQLVHAERLSAIGALVAGLAHEINNPLQTILGNAEMLLDDQRMGPARRDIDIIRCEASRAAQIVRNLLSFARRSSPDRRRGVDLNDIVRSALELRQYHLVRNNVTLHVTLHDAPLGVLVNREEIQQIILNLILNAEHALETTGRGGTISIRTFPLGTHQCVEVADDGPGVNRELRGKIFEPFFTTKDVGEGTGLGLSISHGIAFAHGGSLDLVPDAGPGARFRVTLPGGVVSESEDETPRLPVDAARVALIVDDERPIRTVLGRLLERRGFVVLEADSGEAALPLALERRPGIILCDVRMPGMGGVGFYSQVPSDLRSRFVFMSGDSSQVRNDGYTDHVPLLRKPFSAADLDALLTKAGL